MPVIFLSRRMQIPAAEESFPDGVTLTEIDGGDTYWSDNGFTFGAASFAFNGVTYSQGMDDPKFFPMCPFLERYSDSTDADKWEYLGFNTALAVQGSVNLTLMNTRGVRLFIQSEEWLDSLQTLYHCTLNANCVGIYCADEPGTTADAYDAVDNFACSGTPPGNGGQTGRQFYTTFTHNQITNFDVGGVAMNTLLTTTRTTPCATSRTLGFPGYDIYNFSGGLSSASAWCDAVAKTYGRSTDFTDDLMKRGVRYTDQIRFMRVGNTNVGPNPAFTTNTPMGGTVETGTPYNETTAESHAIRPDQYNAAVWGLIIGGARFVMIFPHGDPLAWEDAGLIVGTAVWDTIRNGASISIYDQVAVTSAQVASLAEVINSPTATGYLTMSPAEQPLTNTVMESGYATLVKYRNRSDDASRDDKFYIFAIPRYGDRTHNNAGADTGAESWPKTATFTIPNTGASQVTILDERGGTIAVTGGGTTFEDSFAGPTSVHIYRVDD